MPFWKRVSRAGGDTPQQPGGVTQMQPGDVDRQRVSWPVVLPKKGRLLGMSENGRLPRELFPSIQLPINAV